MRSTRRGGSVLDTTGSARGGARSRSSPTRGPRLRCIPRPIPGLDKLPCDLTAGALRSPGWQLGAQGLLHIGAQEGAGDVEHHDGVDLGSQACGMISGVPPAKPDVQTTRTEPSPKNDKSTAPTFEEDPPPSAETRQVSNIFVNYNIRQGKRAGEAHATSNNATSNKAATQQISKATSLAHTTTNQATKSRAALLVWLAADPTASNPTPTRSKLHRRRKPCHARCRPHGCESAPTRLTPKPLRCRKPLTIELCRRPLREAPGGQLLLQAVDIVPLVGRVRDDPGQLVDRMCRRNSLQGCEGIHRRRGCP